MKLVGGAGISTSDTPSNQACLPRPSFQAEGVRFPLVYLVVMICPACSVALEAAIDSHVGKGSGELEAFRVLQDTCLCSSGCADEPDHRVSAAPLAAPRQVRAHARTAHTHWHLATRWRYHQLDCQTTCRSNPSARSNFDYVAGFSVSDMLQRFGHFSCSSAEAMPY